MSEAGAFHGCSHICSSLFSVKVRWSMLRHPSPTETEFGENPRKLLHVMAGNGIFVSTFPMFPWLDPLQLSDAKMAGFCWVV